MHIGINDFRMCLVFTDVSLTDPIFNDDISGSYGILIEEMYPRQYAGLVLFSARNSLKRS